MTSTRALIVLLVMVVLLIFCGGWVGYAIGEYYHQVAAVKAGHAEWIPDQYGYTYFAWKVKR